MIDLDRFSTSDGIEYKRNRYGGITQINPKPFVYDKEYNKTYDTEEYKNGSNRLCAIRWELITSVVDNPKKVLDFGFGNGAFLDHIADKTKAFGYDVASGYESDKWKRVEKVGASYDVVCFWDSLEHCKNISFVKHLKAKHIAISLPWLWCETVEQFNHFKHRKPDEHIHHFDVNSLINFFEGCGYELKKVSFAEDEVRNAGNRKNILSAMFKKK